MAKKIVKYCFFLLYVLKYICDKISKLELYTLEKRKRNYILSR